MKLRITLLALTASISLSAQIKKAYNAIYSGVPWFDDKGNTVSAHGANIVKDNGKYYLFGERHKDGTNAFAGFNCYSSNDLYNWKFERISLPVQSTGKLDSNSVGERPKVMKCPSTGEYIMYMHADTLGYTGQYVGYATANKITGPYIFRGPLLFNGKPIKKWDMGTFQDNVLLHGGEIYKLNTDYKSITEQMNKAFEKGFESPSIFKKDSLYYFLGSDLTGWERNDNYYFTATSLKGSWTKQGFFAPQGSLTWNSQTTFILPIQGSKETTFMFMGDRWSFPKQNSAATYIWQPLQVDGYKISIPEFAAAWKIDVATGVTMPTVLQGNEIKATDSKITYTGNPIAIGWQQDTLAVKSSNTKGDSFSFTVKGTQVGIYGLARPDGGYASVTIRNRKNKTVLDATIDMYSKYPTVLLKFLSPVLKKDTYTVTVTVLGEKWWWKEKSGRLSGSKGDFISIDRIINKE
jgi:hypothetical protein